MKRRRSSAASRLSADELASIVATTASTLKKQEEVKDGGGADGASDKQQGDTVGEWELTGAERVLADKMRAALHEKLGAQIDWTPAQPDALAAAERRMVEDEGDIMVVAPDATLTTTHTAPVVHKVLVDLPEHVIEKFNRGARRAHRERMRGPRPTDEEAARLVADLPPDPPSLIALREASDIRLGRLIVLSKDQMRKKPRPSLRRRLKAKLREQESSCSASARTETGPAVSHP
jgi:hypothetical protein